MQDEIFELLNPAIRLIYMICFFAMWTRVRDNRSILLMACGYALILAAVLLRFSLAGVADPALAVATHLLVGFGVSLNCTALILRKDLASIPFTFGVIVVLSAAVTGFAAWADARMAQVMVQNLALGLILFATAQALSRSVSDGFLDDAIKAVIYLMVINHFAHVAFLTIAAPDLTADNSQESTYLAVGIVSFVITTILQSTIVMFAFMVDLFRQSAQKAELDLLSGTMMRRAFEDRTARMLTRAKEDSQAVSLIVLDIDNFKQVNDIFGHPAGDEVIRNLGTLINVTVRPTDIVGRVGGEEFCILVWNCEGEAAVGLAERIRRNFAKTEHGSLSKDIRITVSLGVAQWDAEESYANVFARADAALFEAKSAGRDQTRFALGGNVSGKKRVNEEEQGSQEPEVSHSDLGAQGLSKTA